MSKLPANIVEALKETQDAICETTAQLMMKIFDGEITKSKILSENLFQAVKTNDWVSIAAIAQAISTTDRIEAKLQYDQMMGNIGATKSTPRLQINAINNESLKKVYRVIIDHNCDMVLVPETKQAISKAEIESEMKSRGLL